MTRQNREKTKTRRDAETVHELLGMMRARRLLAWIEQVATQSDFAKTYGVSRQYIHALTTTPMGFKTARKLEEKYEMPLGWLEGPDGKTWIERAIVRTEAELALAEIEFSLAGTARRRAEIELGRTGADFTRAEAELMRVLTELAKAEAELMQTEAIRAKAEGEVQSLAV